MNECEIDIEKNREKIKMGVYAVTQADVDSALNSELANIRFSGPIQINLRIRGYGKTVAKEFRGRILGIAIIIGKQKNGSRKELLDTLVHEELEARVLRRAYNEKVDSDIKLLKSGNEIVHTYIEKVIARFFRLKGVD